MAKKKKKATKKASKKSASKGKSAKKKTKKKTTKKAAKKSAKKKNTLAPKMVKTGTGASPAEIGADLVRMFNDGQWDEIEQKYWSPKVTSIEGVGVAQAWTGRKAVQAKNTEWMNEHTIHASRAEGPFVGATGFAVKYYMDVENKANAQRIAMSEVGVYTVKNGKIITEEFMYATG